MIEIIQTVHSIIPATELTFLSLHMYLYSKGATNSAAFLPTLQINLNYCRLAQDLLFQNVVPMGVHVAIVSKHYTASEARGWYTDCTGLVAIGVIPD